MSSPIYQNIEKSLGRGDGFRCAGCGIFTPDKIKLCDCATMVCFRIKDGKSENVWMRYPEDASEPTILPTADRDAIREALKTCRIAINDWCVTYAADMCAEKSVNEAHDRIGKRGTLAYIADAQAEITAALALLGEG